MEKKQDKKVMYPTEDEYTYKSIEPEPTIYEKLAKIQSELKIPKDKENEFGKFKYRSVTDIYEAVKPLLLQNKLTLFMTDKIVNIGNRFYVEASAYLFDMNEVGSISVCAYAREQDKADRMSEPQTTGSSSSYARKYALEGLFLLDSNIDPDSVPPKDNKPKPKAIITPPINQRVQENKWDASKEELSKAKEIIKAYIATLENKLKYITTPEKTKLLKSKLSECKTKLVQIESDQITGTDCQKIINDYAKTKKK